MWHALGARPDLKNQLPLSVRRALIWHVVSTSLPRAETIRQFLKSHLKWTFSHFTCLDSFQTGFPFCFSVPAVLAATCVCEGRSVWTMLTSVDWRRGSGGIDSVERELHGGELIVQVSRYSIKPYSLSICTFNFVCDLSPVILGPLKVSQAVCLQVCARKK